MIYESPLQIDPELAEAIVQNTRRYVSIFSDVVSELLPIYKQKEVYTELYACCNRWFYK